MSPRWPVMLAAAACLAPAWTPAVGSPMGEHSTPLGASLQSVHRRCLDSVVQVVAYRPAPTVPDNNGPRGSPGAGSFTLLWSTGVVMDREGRVLACADAAQPGDSLELRLSNGSRLPARFLAQQVRLGLSMLQAATPAALDPMRTRDDLPPVRAADWLVVYAYHGLGGAPALTLAQAETPDTLANGRPAPLLRLKVPTVKGTCGGAVLDVAGRFRGMAVDVEVLQEPGQLYGGVPEGLASVLDRERLQVLPLPAMRELFDRLRAEETHRLGFLGVMVGPDERLGSGSRAPAVDSLVRVLSVLPGSPADRAGFAQDDRIVSVEGRPATRVTDVRQWISGTSPGSTLHFGLERGGKARSLAVRVGDRSQLDWMDRQRRLNQRIRVRLEESRAVGQAYLPLLDQAIARYE